MREKVFPKRVERRGETPRASWEDEEPRPLSIPKVGWREWMEMDKGVPWHGEGPDLPERIVPGPIQWVEIDPETDKVERGDTFFVDMKEKDDGEQERR